MKEIFPKKHRYFIWAIVVLIAAGVAVLAYVKLTTYEIDKVNYEMVNLPSKPQETFKIENADTEMGQEIEDLSSEISDFEKMANQNEEAEKDLNSFSF